MPTVFLSYSRSDAPIVDKIANDLGRQGVNTWLDRQDIAVGQEWLPQIEQAITTAEFMLVFFSKKSLESEWVKKEYTTAFLSQKKAGGTRLIPVLLEKVDLPPFLASVQYVDFTESYYDGMQQLLRALEVSAGPKPSEVVAVPKLAKQVAGEVAKLLGLEEQARIQKDIHPSTPDIADVDDSNLVFVIISYSDDMEPIFEGIQEAGKPYGLDIQRVKDVVGDYRITDKIIQMIKSARFVIADLTHERPNVYFELGYARGLNKTVITIARNGTPIHFDVKDWNYIEYIDSRILERDLRKRFEYELSVG